VSTLRRFLRALFGDIRWTPPPWARATARPFIAADGFRRREPGRFWAVVLGLVVLAGGGYGIQRYLASRPQPEYLSVTVVDPPPTSLEKDATPNPLRITFSGAAAPLDRIGKDVTDDFTVTPPVAGVWRWESDTSLVFTPAAEWPVGQEYQLALTPGFLAPQALLESSRIAFLAPPVAGTVDATDFWEDPTDPRNKRAVVTLQFTHPIDKASLEQRLALRMRVDPEQRFDGKGSRAVGFKLTFDDVGAKAWVQSEPIVLPEHPGAVQMTLDAGVLSARGGEGTAEKLTAEVPVPSVETYFRVADASTAVATNDAHRMERIGTLQFTAPVRAEDLRSHVTVWELPRDRPAVGDEPERIDWRWTDPAEVVPEVLALARRLDVTWLPSEPEWSREQSFRFDATGGRTLYLRIEKGTKSFGDYPLVQPYTTVLSIEEFPQTVEIMHEGAVLALSGGRKLSVMARNLKTIEIQLARLLPGSIAHLASQTRGDFQKPYFAGSLGILDLAEVFREERSLAAVPPGEPQYEAIDFGKALSDGLPPRGLFQLEVSGWDPVAKEAIDGTEDRRIVLVTDLGFLVKDGLDGTHDVFVMSVATGQPVADAEVQLLGRNGVPVVSRTTDAGGRATLPKTDGLEREKAPVAYVVQKDGDLSFLPFDRQDRRLDLSRYDIGGLSDDQQVESLQAFLFSDRGVYRPGEEVTLGLIVKSLAWTPLPDGLPLEIVITDPRDREIRSETVTVPADGFRDFRFKTLETSPTGVYRVQLVLVRDGERRSVLGQTTVRVEEFLPDRMTIDARLSAPPSPGWISPVDLRARVSLRNLIGTPAVGNRVKGTLRLSPAMVSFPRWKGWSFFDPLSAKQGVEETLAELQTDDAGTAEFELHLERFERATYQLRFLAEGFEAEGNRSVANDATAIVSPLPYLVAWKADGDLDYVKRDSARRVEVVAVGPDLEPFPTGDVTAELIEITFVSVLARQESGLLSYQSVKKEISRGTEHLALGAAPISLTLPTAQPGRFVYVLRDGAGTEVNRIGFEVVGEGNVTGRAERDAELKVRLSKDDYEPGEEVEVSIVAPYAGAGLITIERDRVYASTWFKSDGNATVQRIRVPEDIEGNGYVVVSFVRDLASRDIFLSPLSSGAAPFRVSRARRTQQVTLDVPDRVLPGAPLRIGWNVAEPTKLVVFAVDEGILQVARWRTPDPLSYFFRKRALAVTTAQILDLLLPEYEIVRSLAAPGGDQDALLAGNLNPFKRKGQPPAAYWSGVLDVPAGAGSVEYRVPDVFNGTLRVVAVAVDARAIGVAEAKVLARGPFVVQPTIPYVVAPGDEFEATALVTNTMETGGAAPTVDVVLEPSEGLEVVGAASQQVVVAEGRDAALRWRVRVTGHPGTARGTFRAIAGTNVASATLELSVRPASPFQTTVATGIGDGEVAVDRVLFPELRTVTASAATSPLGLVPGLVRYLDEYPHGCTEQVVSRALPGVVLGGRTDLGVDTTRAPAQLTRAIATLQARQNAYGAFGIWDADQDVSLFLSAYATQFLMEARARGVAIPEGVLRRAVDYLAANLEPGTDLTTLRATAYGLYLVTRSGQVKTPEARALRDALVARPKDEWQGDVAAVFLAATFQQLNLVQDAGRLLDGVSLERDVPADPASYYDALTERGFVLYLLAKHFPERARALPPDAIAGLARELAAFNTLSAGTLILGLDAFSQVVPPANAVGVTITAGAQALATDGTTVLRAAVPAGAKTVRFAHTGDAPLFHQLVQAGFDREPPTDKAAHGIEIWRELRAPGGDTSVSETSITSKLDVVVYVRSTDSETRAVALTDLLPGGFEVDLSSDALATRQSLGAGADTWAPDYVDVREDRVVFYGAAGPEARRFVYRIKPTNRGRYRVPPVYVEGFYDRTAWGRGLGGEIVVGD
jgi:uncharacterized protein YfaS (alpha-2-macroglobulin family)